MLMKFDNEANFNRCDELIQCPLGFATTVRGVEVAKSSAAAKARVWI